MTHSLAQQDCAFNPKAYSAALFLTLLLISPVAYTGETRILSYNVWFDDISGLSHRYQQITDFIAKEDPDYVCLQEVTPVYLAILKKAFLANYQIYDDGLSKKSYGNVVLTKSGNAEVQILPLKTRMNRTALIVQDNHYSIVNIHLESLLKDTNLREQQLSQIINHTQQRPNLIICGDFNFGDDEKENELISKFTDTGKKSGVPTYDITHNSWAEQNKFPDEPTRRLDKILMRTTKKQLRLEVKKLKFSDHYPIVLTIRE